MVGISGLKFTKSANEPIIGENNKRLRKFKLDGLTHSIKFSVSFTVVEGELGIQDLQIDTRPDIQFKLRYFLERYIYFNEKIFSFFFFNEKINKKKIVELSTKSHSNISSLASASTAKRLTLDILFFRISRRNFPTMSRCARENWNRTSRSRIPIIPRRSHRLLSNSFAFGIFG